MPGIVIYRGPSLFDGSPIVVVATFRAGKKQNAKTGEMVQTWILLEDVAPHDAVQGKADDAICGTCVFRGGNGCYVQTWRAPLSVWRAYHRGSYEDCSGDLAAIAAFGEGRAVRLGSYGDPGAIPVEHWEAIISRSISHTGYTHAWRGVERAFRRLVMASVETAHDAAAAQLRGFRTFRVADDLESSRERGEMTCPASKEAGHKVSCVDCHACDGATARGLSARNVTIRLHGVVGSVARAKRAIAAKRAVEVTL